MPADTNVQSTGTATGPGLACSIDPLVFARYPDLRVGAFLADNLDRVSLTLTADHVRTEIGRASATLARAGTTLGNVTRLAAIQQWRRVLASCGVVTAVSQSSLERAVRRLLVEGTLTERLRIVALCAATSARRMAPLHGCDLDTLPSPAITIRPARPGSDWFVPLGARPIDTPLIPEITVYASGALVLCWSFNHATSRQTCLARDTKRAVFFTEAIAADQASAASDALADLRTALEERGALVGGVAVADRNRPDIALTTRDTPCTS